MKNLKYLRFVIAALVLLLSTSLLEAQSRRDADRMSRDRSEHQDYKDSQNQDYSQEYSDSKNRKRQSDHRDRYYDDRRHHEDRRRQGDRHNHERRRANRYEVQSCPSPVRYHRQYDRPVYRSNCDNRRSRYYYGRSFSRLPNGCRTISYRGRDYYYHDGLFYSQINRRNYRIVRPIVGMRVGYIPSFYRLVYIHGHAHFQVDNVIYQRFIDPYGDPCYEIVRIL